MTAHSPALSAAIAMAAAASALLWAAPRMAGGLRAAMAESLRAAVATGGPADDLQGAAIARAGELYLPWSGESPWLSVLHAAAVVLLVAIGAAVVASAVQRRTLLFPRSALPAGRASAPGARWRRLWSRATGFEVMVCTLELLILAALVVELAIRHAVDVAELARFAAWSSGRGAMVAATLAGWLLARVIGALLFFGVIDLGWQHYRRWRALAMSRDEKRREQRDTIGHPGMRAHRRRAHAEILARETR